MYIHHLKDWVRFTWDTAVLQPKLAELHRRRGQIMGQMEALGFTIREHTMLNTLTQDVVKSSEIEGEKLTEDQVRSSIARRLGLEWVGILPADRHVDGIVDMMLDATQHYNAPLSEKRLFAWHSALFPMGQSGLYKIRVGNWRNGPMQVVSGAMGRERVHFEAPGHERISHEMSIFLNWLNTFHQIDPILKAGIAHFWFVTIHPFDDGNGRITRALTDMLLARADQSAQRFYSMSAQILRERKDYYAQLERAQRGDRDITAWLKWFIDCLYTSMNETETVLTGVLQRNQFWERHRETPLNARQQDMLAQLLDGFFGKLNTSKWAKMAKCSHDTALRDIQDMIDKGILEKASEGGRSTSYVLKRSKTA